MKKKVCLLYLLILPAFLFSQTTADTSRAQPHADTNLTRLQADTNQAPAVADTSLAKLPVTPQPTPAEIYTGTMQWYFDNNSLLNSKGKPAAAAMQEKSKPATDIIFYSLLGVTLLLAFLRFFYTRYFNSLFQVFFNTSLRQSQLTDQLLQAKLTSAFFNLFFVATGGLYIYSLLHYYQSGQGINTPLLIITCVVVLAVVYIVKYCVLKFTGWLTGFKEVANTYLFVIFLINKIIAVLLLPLVIAILFSTPGIRVSAVVVSVIMVALMFFLRFIRSYGLLRNKIKVGWFHFLVFIVGVEILPLLLIYKGVVLLLPKSL